MKRLMLLATTIGVLLMPAAASAATLPAPHLAITTSGVTNDACKSDPHLAGCSDGESVQGTLLKNILNGILFAAGIVSFLFVLLGGFRYITSTGDSTRVQKAKDTLLYAVIGLIVTFMAVPIVGWVLTKVG